MLAIPTDPAKAGNILLNYEHRQPLKYIVIVSYKLGIRDHQIIQEDVPELMAKAVPGYESYNSYVHKISPQFIKGYFDCIENKFVKIRFMIQMPNLLQLGVRNFLKLP